MGFGLTAQGDTSNPYDPSDIPGIIQAAATRYGVDPAYLQQTSTLESSNNPKAVSKTGAKGLFQFTSGTAAQYGLRNPLDPAQNADAAARLTSDNQSRLTAALGRQPTSGELYLAHQQGAAGAIALLKNPGQNAADALAPVYGGSRTRAAQALSANGGSSNMTAGDFANQWTSRFNQQGNNAPTQTAPPSNNAPQGNNAIISAPTVKPPGIGGISQPGSMFKIGLGQQQQQKQQQPALMPLTDTPASTANLWSIQQGSA